eukprot:INCI2737.2.p1 GENE.INCI2737.2~~INCI2737.2.p1  ORF type:complete len:688 (-),score=97.25 INCI2737.2:863-2926(-)
MPFRVLSGAVNLFALATATATTTTSASANSAPANSAVDSQTLLSLADWAPNRSVDTFITRDGARLVDASGRQWRFAGFNAYWLGLDENCEPPSWGSGCIHYPSFFRINDTLTTAVALGANVIRGHTLGVSTGNNYSYQSRAGSATFNDEALRTVDYAIARGAELGLRFIVPLTDSYNYFHGGYHDFIDYQVNVSGANASQYDCFPFPLRIPSANDTCRPFFDHAAQFGNATIEGFKSYVSALVNHKNQFTGVALRDEPAILAWETGNELPLKGAPFSNWTSEIATYLKRDLQIKQLVLDGRNEVVWGMDAAALSNEPDVDMYTDHLYKDFQDDLTTMKKDAQITAATSNKVFVVGEYGPSGAKSSDELQDFLSAIESLNSTDANGTSYTLVSGDTWWSYFGHGSEFGFVQHSDSYTLQFPAATADEQEKLMMLREHAFFMTTPSPQPSPAPAPGGQCTDIAPAGHNLTCAQQQSRGKCSQGWMKGYCCKTCFDCKAGCGKASGHVNTPKVVKAAPDDTPPVTTAPVVNGFSCSNRTNATQHAVSCSSASTNLTGFANRIFWRGATLAVSYDVAYSSTPSDPSSWTIICDGCVNDHQVPYSLNGSVFPPGTLCATILEGTEDPAKPPKSVLQSFTVRVRGRTLAGLSGPWSEPVNVCTLPNPYAHKQIRASSSVRSSFAPVTRPLPAP